MPKYFIDVIAGDKVVRDLDGGEYADFAQLREEVLRTICELSRSQLSNGNVQDYVCTARGADGSVALEGALTLRLKQP